MSRPFRRFRRPFQSRKRPQSSESTSGFDSSTSSSTPQRVNLDVLNFSDDESTNAPQTEAGPSSRPKSKRPVVRFFVEQDEDHTETLLGGLSDQYPSWKIYFSNEASNKRPDIIAKLKAFTHYLKQNPNLYDLDSIRKTQSFLLPVDRLLSNSGFLLKWPTFQTCIEENPQETLSIIALSMHQHLEKEEFTFALSAAKNPKNLEKLRVRPSGLSVTCPLKDLKLNRFGNLITICGTIVRVNSSLLVCQWMCYKCKRCGRKQVLKQYRKPNHIGEVIAITPSACQAPCKARTGFVEQLSSQFTQVALLQTIRLQETVKSYEHGRTPRTIDVELDAELVDSTSPGDDVTVTGTLVVVEEMSDHTKTSIMLKAYNLTSKKKLGKQFDVFTSAQLDAIHQIRDEPFTLKLLVRSFCQEICGHDVVKAGLLLSMFGAGLPCSTSERFRSRPEIHVLLVGEPGIGKSQMLQSAAQLSPRSTYVSGHSCSRAGLLASVCKDCLTTTGGIEAGALVLADMGVCCIDELDKMTANEDALLEVMEQQTVSIAKASIICNLTARTTVIAAANPQHGHYDYGRTVAENIRMSPSLLSRFDLIFVLLDNDSQEGDVFFSNHIERLNSSCIDQPARGVFSQTQVPRRRFGDLQTIASSVFQSYIAYARQNCHPKLGEAAKGVIQTFWRQLRHEQAITDTISITPRQLFALIRLTLARARIDLVDEATLEHAQDVIAIMKRTIFCRQTDASMPSSSSTLVMQRIGAGRENRTPRGMGLKAQMQRFLTAARNFSTMKKKKLLATDDLKYIAGLAQVTKLNEILEVANLNGFLLKKPNGLFELVEGGF